MTDEAPVVLAVSRDGEHHYSKPLTPEIVLVEGLGVEGDAHLGRTIKHRFRVVLDPTEPNLRQVHLMHAELFEEMRERGFEVGPGQMGENITTRGLDLLALPTGTRLHIGPEAVIEVTGLRNPCRQIDQFQKGLLKTVLGRDDGGAVVYKAGIMSIVVAGGTIRPGDAIDVHLPAEPHRPLMRV